MLSKIKIKNFKSFSQEANIPLAPITLIFGPNSSGKSSIIQALLAAKQTINNQNKNGELLSSGDFLDLGGFESVISNHDLERQLKIGISFFNGLSINEYMAEFMCYPVFGSDEIREFDLSYKYKKSEDNGEGNKNYLSSFDLCVHQINSDKNIFEMQVRGNDTRGYIFNSESINEMATFFNKRDKRIKKPSQGEFFNELIKLTPFISPVASLPLFVNADENFSMIGSYFDSLAYEIKYELSKINYLGPLRTHPKRFYSSERANVKKNKGETNLGAELFYSGTPGQKKVNNWLSKFDIPYELEVENIGNEVTGNIISLMLRDIRNNTKVTPADVGFGIGQVLPIITCAIAKKHQIICVEQPEIHLHPRLQAHLADLFISTSDINEGGNQWIVETHSEALMLRVQRRIKEGKIDKNRVCVLYVDVGKSGTSVEILPLDKDGDFLKHWPDGFFEERLNETMGFN